jgi:uncharacterized protein YjiS (DUF1127 family)
MQAKLLDLPRFHAAPGSWTGLAAPLVGWLRHRAERISLARLDDRTLDDVGLTRADVEREFTRPFWQPVDYAALEATRRRSGPRLGR